MTIPSKPKRWQAVSDKGLNAPGGAPADKRSDAYNSSNSRAEYEVHDPNFDPELLSVEEYEELVAFDDMIRGICTDTVSETSRDPLLDALANAP